MSSPPICSVQSAFGLRMALLAMTELAASIKLHGLIQPLIVTETVEGFVLMFAGVAYAFAAPRKSGPTGVVREDGSVDPSTQPGRAPHRA